mmetsp:Transcript_23837/g.34855  ORF Transcript_23837/g.34855 Transcript_23837/m.34855 type:complete len:353 (+) Transcript_23837:59-1117(+)
MTSSVAHRVAMSVILYSVCSSSLVLVNKLILHHLPYPSLVITVQLFAALLFIVIASSLGKIERDPIKWAFVKPYLIYTFAFSLGVYCNMRSLSVSNVETVIVFRALAPLLVSVLDALFLGREWPSCRSWFALLLIAFGAYGYAMTDEKFQTMGMNAYLWPFCYLCVISFEMAYGKRIVSSVKLVTLTGPVLYTNMLGWPPMLVFAGMGGEYSRFWNNLWIDDNRFVEPVAWVLLCVGCVVGTAIGYSSWWCRGQVSATSFTLIGVINKCLTVLVNTLIWDQHAVPIGIASLSLCLVGGALYRQAPMRGALAAAKNVGVQSTEKTDSTETDEEMVPHSSSDNEEAVPLVRRTV